MNTTTLTTGLDHDAHPRRWVVLGVLCTSLLLVMQGNTALNLINVYRYLGGGWEIRTQSDKGSAGPMSCLPAPIETPAASSPEPLPKPKPAVEPK